ncbi:hypothetical protein FO519_006896 [Halicephalobus sp. NKZ332]|nr:hypothetical protein FO519_006896 [Halicephalobus sp. NKZ332]
MADQFVGKWNFVDSDNFEPYLKEVGVGLMTRKMAATLKPQIVFEADGNKWKMTSVSTFKTIVVEFELDKEFEETTGDGRKCLSTFSLRDGKLVQEQKAATAGEKSSHFERWIEGDKLIITGESGGVKFRRTYERA